MIPPGLSFLANAGLKTAQADLAHRRPQAQERLAQLAGPGPAAGLTMHSMLETPLGFTLMASDSHPEMGPFVQPAGFSVSLSGDDQAERLSGLEGYREGPYLDVHRDAFARAEPF